MRFRKTSVLAKILIVIVAVYALVTLVSLQDRITAANTEREQLKVQVEYAEQEQTKLLEAIRNLGTEDSIRHLARERLGMVAEGEIVFFDSND